MSYSLQKSMVAKVVGISLVMLLAACSSDQRYKRQVSGDESYLKAPALHALNTPAGMILPVQNGDYDIPPVTLNGAVGKELDIRPPVQPLALLNGSRTQTSGDTATLLLENSAQNSQLWSQVIRVLQDKAFTIASRQDANQTLTTDWISWPREDEDVPYQGRYQISVQQQGYQVALVVKLIGLQLNGQPVTAGDQTQRYTGLMLNALSNGLDSQATERENALANRTIGSLDVQSGADDTGLPLLIVRGPYTVVWDRLPVALDKIGMKVNDRSRPQGSVSVTYRAPSGGTWDDLGAKNPELPNGDYKLQVGDLDNRSSLQFIDSKGHTLTQSQNDALVAVFQAAFSK
ncbi:outer membrane protein assembly factor BamC [Pectobacterium quasiaquaticum]|uniref:Outer membrane protein assembly factor BamC n=1 Tax=Pectobacterium quasiaquaticum TaxID=2774015 RepID=A0A9Q2EMU0_9GAMM|nr:MULTISPECIES: outer membrane protein assembly factor BamC [Pectobacterium]MBE5201601.1 outer membrane protein assembly factor BamC [Pectobacterium quasiaquaticum]MBE5210750.1 outer membrane protein assembly factor BamC [Pectobacterium quasiaquaticum]MBE5213702.1 outer membrane protein assembly factor BamC [Pectobacterium quasiaquaticum]MBE5220671.1 outer membrane protein assembly factor BamC [Pectobacterium quasiaquaticum]MBE5225457.1 outer membrane protein assembly factor BamC [Pectobacter